MQRLGLLYIFNLKKYNKPNLSNTKKLSFYFLNFKNSEMRNKMRVRNVISA